MLKGAKKEDAALHESLLEGAHPVALASARRLARERGMSERLIGELFTGEE